MIPSACRWIWRGGAPYIELSPEPTGPPTRFPSALDVTPPPRDTSRTPPDPPRSPAAHEDPMTDTDTPTNADWIERARFTQRKGTGMDPT